MVARAEDCRVQIERDGLVVKTKSEPRDHPALKHELANRSFVIRALTRLGLDVEPLGRVGRPSSPFGIKGIVDNGE